MLTVWHHQGRGTAMVKTTVPWIPSLLEQQSCTPLKQEAKPPTPVAVQPFCLRLCFCYIWNNSWCLWLAPRSMLILALYIQDLNINVLNHITTSSTSFLSSPYPYWSILRTETTANANTRTSFPWLLCRCKRANPVSLYHDNSVQ